MIPKNLSGRGRKFLLHFTLEFSNTILKYVSLKGHGIWIFMLVKAAIHDIKKSADYLSIFFI